jgi:hypothetical protein
MKKINALVALVVIIVMALSIGCTKQTSQEKVKEVSKKVYILTPDEISLAEVNAKQFFEKEWPTLDGTGSATKKRGVLVNVRPTDSNYNGLVTSIGKIPKDTGGYDTITMYCGYQKDGIQGCSDQDTVGR